MEKIRCFSDIQEGKSDILKGLVRYPLGITSTNCIQGGSKILYPKGIMKGHFNRGGPILNGMAHYSSLLELS